MYYMPSRPCAEHRGQELTGSMSIAQAHQALTELQWHSVPGCLRRTQTLWHRCPVLVPLLAVTLVLVVVLVLVLVQRLIS